MISSSPVQTAVEWKLRGDKLYTTPGTLHKEDGRTFNCRDAYLEALKHDPEYGAAWGRLATCTCRSELIPVNGTRRSKLECGKLALKYDPSDADGWYIIGSFNDGQGSFDGSNAKQVVVHEGVGYTALECFAKAISSDPDHSCSWDGIGDLAEANGGTIEVLGESYSSMDAFRRSLQLDITSFTSWCNMGASLSGASTNIDGKTFTEMDCYQHALLKCKRHPFEVWRMSEAWTNIGCLVDANGGSVTIAEKSYSRIDCFVEALHHDPFDPVSWRDVALQLLRDHTGGLGAPRSTVTIGGKEFDWPQCCVEALRQDPSHATAWNLLKYHLQGGDETIEVDGVHYTAEECAQRDMTGF